LAGRTSLVSGFQVRPNTSWFGPFISNEKKLDNIDPRAEQSLTLEKIRQEGFDSVFVPRDTHARRGVFNDEFVIYDPDQALPKYIIHYSLNNEQQLDESSTDAEADEEEASTDDEYYEEEASTDDEYYEEEASTDDEYYEEEL